MTAPSLSIQPPAGRPRAALVAPYPPTLTETFIRAHASRMPADTLFLHSWRPTIGDRTVLSAPEKAYYKVRRMLLREPIQREQTAAYVRAFRQHGARVVIAEYGQTSYTVLEACRTLGIPLVGHFHGYDASRHDVLAEWMDRYRVLFRDAAGIIAVSRAMRRKLIELGAPAERVHWNPCGVDVDEFPALDPGSAGPTLVAIGRLTEKKGPDYTIRAFALALREVPDAKLRLLGGGRSPLGAQCRVLVEELGIAHAVTFLGARPHEEVAAELRLARAFVQHSVVAASGDSEGTPVSVLEAGASGLAVIGTRHAGIPDVVVDGETGLLVEERDIEGMAAHMVTLLRDPALARRLGAAARVHVAQNFSMDLSVRRLWAVAEACMLGAPLTGTNELVRLPASPDRRAA